MLKEHGFGIGEMMSKALSTLVVHSFVGISTTISCNDLNKKYGNISSITYLATSMSKKMQAHNRTNGHQQKQPHGSSKEKVRKTASMMFRLLESSISSKCQASTGTNKNLEFQQRY